MVKDGILMFISRRSIVIVFNGTVFMMLIMLR